ncbi:MAG TPA: recombination protein RecR [Candidatus Pullichristensenella excrementigallinarum]|uniref:Recombination protein RecR n=1 Tax=Candidatus Pullichristensenella excrementigallinarum TaxID=2840907 RepID=A0A9D1LCZ7_9FIRM|nr:recombination protein RecR [Candidatus Pullichristensenella excrementigallinarum]
MAEIEAIARMVNQLARLPGVGRKTAQRLAYHILEMPEDQVRELAVAIFDGKKKVKLCPVCGNYTEGKLCAICRDSQRRRDIVCVVKDPRDVNAMERMRDYNGLYHVLHGVISPMDGVGPDDIRIRELLSRLGEGEIREVVLATNPDVEGEATAAYISRLIKPLGVKVTRIAHGVPVGGELEYTDEITLMRAFQGRREL